MKSRFARKQKSSGAKRPLTENELLHHEIAQKKKELVEFIKTLEKL
jgi:hypothetical protein